MYKVVIAFKGGMECSYGTHATARDAVNAYSSGLAFIMSDAGEDADSEYDQAMLVALGAVHPSADEYGNAPSANDDGVWTVTYRFDGSYVRMTGGL